MKKILTVFALVMLFSQNIYAAGIMVNDKDIWVTPVIINDRILVPVRGVFENLGYAVMWNEDTKTALIVNNENRISIRLGANVFYVNSKTVTPDVPQRIIDSSMYIPLRSVAEAVGADVYWNEDTKTAHITTKERVITLDTLSKVNTLESIFTKHKSIYLKNEYNFPATDFFVNSYEITFGKDENSNYVYLYKDSNGLKRLMCYEGEFSITDDGSTSSLFYENDSQRNAAVIDSYNFVDSSIMIAYSERGSIFNIIKLKDYYKATVSIKEDENSPTYFVWANAWGITDKEFNISYEYVIDPDSLLVSSSNVTCTLSDGRMNAGNTSISYDSPIEIPAEFKELIEKGSKEDAV